MSLTITNNGDGTITASCGSESLTVSVQDIDRSDPGGYQGSSAGPKPMIIVWPKVTPNPGAVVADMVDRRPGQDPEMRYVIRARTEFDKIIATMREDMAAKARTPGKLVLCQVDWVDRAPIDASVFTRAMAELEEMPEFCLGISFPAKDE